MKLPVAEICDSDLSRPQCAVFWVVWIVAICVAIVLLQASPACGQDGWRNGQSNMGQDSSFPGATPHRLPESGPAIYDNNPYRNSIRLAQFRVVRAKALIKDTNKLVKLATELNAEVGGANAKRIGSAQLRKVSKIAKLAHNIEENMKLTYTPVRSAPIYIPSPYPSRSQQTH